MEFDSEMPKIVNNNVCVCVCVSVCVRDRVRVRGVTLGSQTSNIHRSIKLKSVSTLLSDFQDWEFCVCVCVCVCVCERSLLMNEA